MNGTTEQPKAPEVSNRNLRWLVLLLIAILGFIFVLSVARRAFQVHGFEFVPPYITAGGLIVKQGIAEFRTGSPEAIPVPTTLKVVLALLIIYVAAPTVVIFYLLRLRYLAKTEMPKDKVGVKDALFGLGFLIALLLLAIVVAETTAGCFISPSTFAIMKKDNDNSYRRDMLSKELLIAYVDCMQYYYQTEHFGGNSRNLNAAGAAPVRSAGDLGIKAKSEFGTLYLDPVKSDTMIVLNAVGTGRGSAAHFRNADGDSGKVQCSMIIRPFSHKYEIVYAN
jgi:hypothetical protein